MLTFLTNDHFVIYFHSLREFLIEHHCLIKTKLYLKLFVIISLLFTFEQKVILMFKSLILFKLQKFQIV